MDARQALTRPNLRPGEQFRSDAIVVCLTEPLPYNSPNPIAHLQITQIRYFYLPGDGTFAELWYLSILLFGVAKKDFNSRIVDITMTSGEHWQFDVFPQTARIMKRWFNRCRNSTQ